MNSNHVASAKGNAPILILVLCTIIVIGYLVMQNIHNSSVMSEYVRLRGTQVCLPYKDVPESADLDCALGIAISDGTYYALDLSMLSTRGAGSYAGDEIEVIGILYGVDDIPKHLERYDVSGSVRVYSTFLVNQEVMSSKQVMTPYGFTFTYPADFNVVKNDSQLEHAYQGAPCMSNFNFCIYYNGTLYEHTNFESASVQIRQRDDLNENETLCLEEQPEGNTDLSFEIRTGNLYSTSLFNNMYYSDIFDNVSRVIYRLYYNDMCYEFETRIVTQTFQNLNQEQGETFTMTDQRVIEDKLESVIRSIRLGEQMEIVFPNL